ncbi:hypothetical protein TTHERM_000002589 (macronuclear) [Tetrahymena thermophila SB210]|uniref:Uncharacterized protein n=1 Tax=Tetrahymena thermophila (strain SB210) TaxID=312017 RepID=W7XA98_TETTS|nr:hypothetical protein TTHERM_000002589 [Tetrahymena thermophila SB210]EWS76295.1 hypothetical protein TTHERM_000002589 [Tetrahymena thermophila SB210]|eukprot:XP_012651079.1 hypothetical protein TTHERM_000002589 [Tetrahymena thermophila SB210]
MLSLIGKLLYYGKKFKQTYNQLFSKKLYKILARKNYNFNRIKRIYQQLYKKFKVKVHSLIQKTIICSAQQVTQLPIDFRIKVQAQKITKDFSKQLKYKLILRKIVKFKHFLKQIKIKLNQSRFQILKNLVIYLKMIYKKFKGLI